MLFEPECKEKKLTWIVTGASRGLGHQIALSLATRGHRVIAVARDGERLVRLADRFPDRIKVCALDLAEPQQIRSSIESALDGEAALQGVVNNAGFGHFKPFVKHGEAEALQILQVNLGSVIQICHAVLPRLLQQRGGHIVNIGSDLARRPLANMAVYSAAKHGLAGFTHSLLREVKGAGIKVSLINPGIIDTDFGGAEAGSRDPRGSLQPGPVAELIMQVIDQPGLQNIDELLVHPLQQDEY